MIRCNSCNRAATEHRELIDTLQQLQQSIDGNKRKNESLFGMDSRMDGRRAWRAAQTKDFSLQVSFYLLQVSKTASEAKEKPVFLFEAVFLIHISNIFPCLTCNPSRFSLAHSLSVVCLWLWLWLCRLIRIPELGFC